MVLRFSPDNIPGGPGSLCNVFKKKNNTAWHHRRRHRQDQAWLSPESLYYLTSTKHRSTVGPNSRPSTGCRAAAGRSTHETSELAKQSRICCPKTGHPPSPPWSAGEGDPAKPKSPAATFPAPAQPPPPKSVEEGSPTMREGARQREGPDHGRADLPPHPPASLRHQGASHGTPSSRSSRRWVEDVAAADPAWAPIGRK
ncbi:hypothetical protein C2845_PM05G22810 [Panicum miliaceum]|uniref:Uncharacterized protein n=1 Tax=Panicum miliaceum TaxID=4540 RepID=A0A3L6SX58_PANMI|nr:hypothetical protein C2845_PM05G22810 [Panicum miliaceum]